MQTILEEKNNLLEIKKSKFYGYLFHAENAEHFNTFLKRVKKEHPRADHVVYAYVLSKDDSGYSDANEPKGTAGRPVLNVIEKNSLSMVSIFIVRYFGGIKLGAGGLVRAYTQTASELISSSEKKSLVKAVSISFSLNYDELNRFLSQIKENSLIILNKKFGENVDIDAIIKEGMFPSLKNDTRVLSLKILKKDFLYPF